MDRDIVLEALGILCNAHVTSVQKRGPHGGSSTGAEQHQMLLRALVSTVLDADETRSNFERDLAGGSKVSLQSSAKFHPNIIINEDEFFDKEYNYDFTKVRDTQTFYRGGEKYKRPCGWYRFGLRVLDKYENNTWLGNEDRTTESVPGEWPVSYHGTSDMRAQGIIRGNYEPGSRQRFGRGVYSTPDLSVAERYAKQFKKDGKTYKVVLQNRINPEYREKHNQDKYWLIRIPKETSPTAEQQMVARAIRPYGLLLKEI